MGAGSGSNLGDLKVEFGEKGFAELQAKMKALQDNFDKTANKGSAMRSLMGGVMGGAGMALGAGAIGAVMGAAKSGMGGSSEMERINQTLDRMSKLLAGAFAPALDAIDVVLQAVQPMVSKFAENIGMVIGFWAQVAERLFVAVAPLMDKLLKLQEIFYDLALSAIEPLVDFLMNGLEVAIVIVTKALEWLVEMAKQFFDLVGAKHHASGARTLGKAGGGFEAVDAIYKRIQTAALKTGGGKSAEELLADIAKQTKAGENFQAFMEGWKKIWATFDDFVTWVRKRWPFS